MLQTDLEGDVDVKLINLPNSTLRLSSIRLSRYSRPPTWTARTAGPSTLQDTEFCHLAEFGD